jgi:hypothetical protein
MPNLTQTYQKTWDYTYKFLYTIMGKITLTDPLPENSHFTTFCNETFCRILQKSENGLVGDTRSQADVTILNIVILHKRLNNTCEAICNSKGL